MYHEAISLAELSSRLYKRERKDDTSHNITDILSLNHEWHQHGVDSLSNKRNGYKEVDISDINKLFH